MIACVGSLFRRRWAAAGLGTLLLYGCANSFSSLLTDFVQSVCHFDPTAPFNTQLLYSLGPLLFLSTLIGLSHLLVQPQQQGLPQRDMSAHISHGLWGTPLVVFGVFFRRIDTLAFGGSVVTILAVILIVLGTAAILFWHVRLWHSFWASSGIVLSLGLLLPPHVQCGVGWRLLPWSLPLGFGAVGLLTKRPDRQLSLMSIGLAVVLAILCSIGPFP